MTWFGRVLLFALLVAAGVAIWAFFDGEGWWRPGTGETAVTAAAPTDESRERTEQATQTAPVSGATEQVRPAFDIVRVEDTGEAVIAGVAPPGWTVRVETPERLIGKVKAGFDGSWVLLPDAPLPAGDHSLSVSARAPDGSRTVHGGERVAISVSPQSAPAVVALSQDNEPTRILQSGQSDAIATESVGSTDHQTVTFSAVDYEDKTETGRVYLSGTAAPGARIALYLDNRFIGSTKAEVDGSWEFALTDILDAGQHMLRADHVDLDRGDVLSRAEVRFNPEAVAVAAVEGGETRMARTGEPESLAQEQRLRKPIGEDAAVRSRTGTRNASKAGKPRKQAIIVKRGDTLWHIAEEHYGSGVRYSKIFRTNRDQIRNPHRIYPGQQFELPR